MDRTDIEIQAPGSASHEVSWKNLGTDDDSSTALPDLAARAQPPSRRRRRIATCVSFVLFAVIAAVVFSVGFRDTPNPLDFFVQEDPPGRNETHEWRTQGNNGLTLIIENALDVSWTPYLTMYVEKWDAGVGQVDPLTLSVQRVEPDFQCDPSRGKLKICNGDYGRNDWRGINIILLRNGLIAHSVAKLNDYWLQKDGEFHRRYTMCHELGHGFGLAHTDEDYSNFNTGECMDYTTRPRSNLDPGEFNFNLLASIYGTTSEPSDQDSQPDDQSPPRRAGEVVDGQAVPDLITEQYYKAVKQLESMVCRDCLIDLGDGYQVEIHMLGVD